MKRFIYIAILLLVTTHTLSAQHTERVSDLINTKVYFGFNSVETDTSVMRNRQSVAALFNTIDSLGLHSIDSITIWTLSSPEGATVYNTRLSEHRGESVFHLLAGRYPSLSEKIHLYTPKKALQHLVNLILDDPHFTNEEKDQTIRIIASDRTARKKVAELSELPFYSRLVSIYYPLLRHSHIRVYYSTAQSVLPVFAPVPLHLAQMAQQPAAPVLPGPQQLPTPKYFRHTLFVLKTNLLYDAVTAVNLAIEVPLGRRWSIEVEDVCPWWHNGNKWAFQLLQVSGEGRYWFKRTQGRKVLTGHFGGLYAMGGMYDVQNGYKFGYQGEFWSTGLTYGYAMPVGKYLNMEFSLSIGFLSTHYQHYYEGANGSELVVDPYDYGISRYFGPTKAKIALICPINIKTRKGGHR